MTSILRQPTSNGREISVALDAMACYTSHEQLTYVAVPITGGPRFLEWYEPLKAEIKNDSKRYLEGLRKNVIEPNSIEAKKNVLVLMHREACSVVDPSRLTVPTWTQNDYLYFWSKVIERYATRTIFLDGWQLSSGCTYEFYVANTFGVPAFDARLERMQVAEGVRLIERGIHEYRRIGADSELIEEVLAELTEIEGQK